MMTGIDSFQVQRHMDYERASDQETSHLAADKTQDWMRGYR